MPACMTYMPYHTIQDDECVIAPAISTGAACATTIVEGLLKGICELIERDAFMIIWRNRIPCPRIVIDPRSTLYPLFRERFERPGLDYFLFHTTLDLQIPSVFGILREYRTFQHTGLAVVLQGLVRPRLRGTELEFWRNSEEARTDRPSQQLRSLNGEWRLMRYFLLTHLCGISHRIWCTLSTICSDAA